MKQAWTYQCSSEIPLSLIDIDYIGLSQNVWKNPGKSGFDENGKANHCGVMTIGMDW